MKDSETNHTCRACRFTGTGKYCSHCGQPYEEKRISLRTLFNDIFHLFTHLDKGFGFTLKQLAVAPGTMQRAYIEGDRFRHQKPFSMFFICATVAALTRYWIIKTLSTYYDAGNINEADFFNEYLVLLQIILLPVYTLIAYVFFYKSKFNYAEIGVLMLYTTSLFFVLSIFISFLKFVWHDLDTAYVEFPVLLIYNAITFVHFFREQRIWWVVVKSVLMITCIFLLIQIVEDFFLKRMY
jgi:hypothetical protein